MPVNWGRDPVEKSGEEVHKMLLFLAFLAPQPNLLQRRPATCCTLPKGRRTHYFSLRRDLSTWQSMHRATDILMIVSYLPTFQIFLLHSCFSLPSPCITVLPIYVGFHTIFFSFLQPVSALWLKVRCFVPRKWWLRRIALHALEAGIPRSCCSRSVFQQIKTHLMPHINVMHPCVCASTIIYL